MTYLSFNKCQQLRLSSTSYFTRFQQVIPKQWHHPNFMHNASAIDKENWLESLLQQPKTKDQVDTEAFLIVLRALAKSNLPDAALRAERWLLLLENMYTKSIAATTSESNSNSGQHEILTVPNSECYQRVIEAWANASKEDPSIAVTRAERWLTRRIDCDQKSMRPNTASYNAFLDLCSKGRALKRGSHGRALVQQHAEKAKETLLMMIQDRNEHGNSSTIAPDTDSFNYTIRAFTRLRFDPDIADKAMEILRELEQYERSTDDGVHPTIKSYAMVMDAIAVRAKQIVRQNLSKKYTWKDPAQNGLNQIKLLKEIIAFLSTEVSPHGAKKTPWSRRQTLEPNAHVYNVLISAWANLSSPMHPHAPLEAEKILHHMISLQNQGGTLAVPDAYSYQAVIRAWKNSSKPNRGSRSNWWLQRQWNDFSIRRDESLQPITASYNLVMQVWADLCEPRVAEQLIEELILMDKKRQYRNLVPNSESYAAVIKAWLIVAKKGSVGALHAAASWMKKVTEEEKRNPTGVTSAIDWYLEFFGAALKCAPQAQTLDLVLEIYDQLQHSHHSLDCLHFARLIQVGLICLSRESENNKRDAFLRKYIQESKQAGMISRPLVRSLANGPVFYDGWTIEESQRVVERFFPDWPLPNSWTCNVGQDGFLPRRADLIRRNFHLSHHGHQAH